MARPHAPRGQGRKRVLDAAQNLFAEHGVHGTSLQMIADRLGVTKAAVYYQFKAKDDIALALVNPIFASLRDVVAEAEAASVAAEQVDIAVRGLAGVSVKHRQVTAAMYKDPDLDRLVRGNPELRALGERLYVILVGTDPEVRRRVGASLVVNGMAHPGNDEALVDLSDEDLLESLVAVAHSALGTEPPKPKRVRKPS